MKQCVDFVKFKTKSVLMYVFFGGVVLYLMLCLFVYVCVIEDLGVLVLQ